jgi:hypothetical protein
MQNACARREQIQDVHGPDPWQFVDCHEAAKGLQSTTAADVTSQTTVPTLRSQLLSHFGGREQGTNVSLAFFVFSCRQTSLRPSRAVVCHSCRA